MSTESGDSVLLPVGPVTGPGPGRVVILHLSTVGRTVLGYSRRWRNATLSLVDVSFVSLLRLALIRGDWLEISTFQHLQPLNWRVFVIRFMELIRSENYNYKHKV